MRQLRYFIIRVRHWLKFRQWPQNIVIAELNVRAGHAVYFTGQQGSITFAAEVPTDDTPRVVGRVVEVRDDGTGGIRIGDGQ